jgi:shikimate kinase
MTLSRPIILIGLRASGKSSVGRALGARCDVPFVDLDDLTAQLLNVSDAGSAITALGLETFRQAEIEALMDQLQRIALTGPIVLSLGGGTPMAAEGPEVLRFARDKCKCEIVYLHASVDELRSRLEKTDLKSRPSITGQGTLAEVATLYAQRDPVYRGVATRVVESGGKSVAQVVEEIAGETPAP